VGVPLQGASSVSGKAVVNGVRLALAKSRGRVGRFHIALKVLNDATAAQGEWDPGQTSSNAVQAAADATTIGYIGDLDSGASAVSIPILNQAGIPQISPRSTAVGLTSAGPGSQPGEPAKYYPTHLRTFARVAPSDAVQAAVQVKLQQSLRCTKTYVLADEEVDGEDFAVSFGLAAQRARLSVVATQQYDPRATSYAPLAASIASSRANCVLVSAISGSNAVPVTRQVAKALPNARIFAGAGVAQSTYVDPIDGGVPLAVDSRLLITSPALGMAAYPRAARSFLAAYERRYGPPEPDAILGYESMRLMLSAIRRATDDGRKPASRSAVRRAILHTRDRHSVLGTYSIDPDGNTSLNAYGVWRAVGGSLRFWKALQGS
ncbi:MAG: branched-chain amino acid ABC transporter substrate-binding protein, partial [Solirubrobacterales bacterium]|nr:branched-chain amino acid ABC transporter substrate-binding protein [Solirubrobacterales bacterium]